MLACRPKSPTNGKQAFEIERELRVGRDVNAFLVEIASSRPAVTTDSLSVEKRESAFAVYLVRKPAYQFFNCGVRSQLCKSMFDLHRTNCWTMEGNMAKKAKKAKAKKKKTAKKK